ncbi:MAG TPA: diguanylate cyclase [Thermoleophilaceae bacterium]|jgi:diguanylate cyclase (GGDEF)-like protein
MLTLADDPTIANEAPPADAERRELPRPVATFLVALRGFAAGATMLYAVFLLSGIGGDSSSEQLAHWFNGVLLGIGAFLCLARSVLVGAQRSAWFVAGMALATWGAGETLFALGHSGSTFSTPNMLSLSFYPLACLAMALLLRAQLKAFFTTLWLDGLAGALSASALVAAFVFPPVLANTHGSTLEILGSISYPLADLLIVAFVLFTLAMTGWRPSSALGGAAAAFVVIAITDAFSLWAAATSTDTHSELDWLWPAAALALAEVGWRAAPVQARVSGTSLRLLMFPVVVSLTALGLLLSGLVQELHMAGYELATASLFLIVVRLALTVLENLQIADASKREALTDALTGLGNRRRLMGDVETALEKDGGPTILVLYDLDGFKGYNDTFGHPAGDALLTRLGAALSKAVVGCGTAYRPGGDEFCALLSTDGVEIDEKIADTVAALSERGRGFAVTPSYGSVVIPDEARDVTLALQLADKRLYEQKGDRRRTRDGAQVRDVLMQALRERRPDLDEHIGGVASLAHAVARRFSLNTEQVDEVTKAAELHDIGKMAVPDAILEKPASLDDRERAMIKQHTVVGERILAVAPALRSIGKLVRYSHERWDGTGYPDRLRGDEIPLGARIIAVCDAFDAMTTDRPYQPAVPLDEALDELRRCAGTQFDPAVVEVFCEEAEAVLSDIEDAQPERIHAPGGDELANLVLRVPEEEVDPAAREPGA